MDTSPLPTMARAPADVPLSRTRVSRPPAYSAGRLACGDYRLRPALCGDHRPIRTGDLGGMKEAGGRLRPVWQQNMAICRYFTGATGLEPATSGVTGRSWYVRAGPE